MSCTPSEAQEHAQAKRIRTLTDLSDAEVFQLWSKYEDVAMHFNDLLMRWRLQALGGLTTLVTIAGFVVGGAETLEVRYRAMLLLSITLLFAWIAVAWIDVGYYRNLLVGAVKAITEVEEIGPIRLSSMIDAQVRPKNRSHWMFYALTTIPLLVLLGWSLVNLVTVSDEELRRPIPHICSPDSLADGG